MPSNRYATNAGTVPHRGKGEVEAARRRLSRFEKTPIAIAATKRVTLARTMPFIPAAALEDRPVKQVRGKPRFSLCN
jgi:hypothetical protein